MGLGLPIFGLQLPPKAAYLRLEAEGFTHCVLFRARTVRWENIQEIAVIGFGPLGATQRVVLTFTPEYLATRRPTAMSKALLVAARAKTGYEGALPDTYGMKAQELADIMNGLLRQSGKSSRA